jgi:sulfatase maturation enzyme AslB (radical SAM superfamily)
LIKSIITLANQTAEKNELKPYYYLATNGVLSIKNAQWISKNFQKIGISCDGPGFIQDRQRPRQNHLGSSRYVEQTVSIIRDAGAQFAVRVTVTPDSLFYMEEIAEYICTVLKPDEIHIEPIYYGGRAQKINNYLFSPSEAHNFLENYFNAQRIATKHGIPWLTSGSRLEDIHGPYCNTLRNVLNLIPGGCATACFKASTIEECISKDMVVGSSTKNMTGDDYFEINHNKVQKINKNILDSSNSTKCADCFNKYHCVRTCPDRCLLEKTENSDTSEFRCFFQKLLSTRIILESANHFMNEDFFKQDIIGGAVSSIQQSP